MRCPGGLIKPSSVSTDPGALQAEQSPGAIMQATGVVIITALLARRFLRATRGTWLDRGSDARFRGGRYARSARSAAGVCP